MKILYGILMLGALLAVNPATAGTATIYGPTTVTVGANNVYSVSLDGYGYLPSGDYSWYGGDIQSSSATGAHVKFYASGYLSYNIDTFDNYYYGSLEITIDVPTPAASGINITPSCGSTVVTRNNSPPANFEWYWQTSASGTSTSLGYNYLLTLTSSTPLYLRARCVYDAYTWSTAQTISASSIAVTGAVTGAGTISGGSSLVWSGTAPATFTNATLPSTTLGTDYTFQWQKQESGGSWTDIPSATSSTYTSGSLVAATSFRRNVIGNCDASVRSTSGISVTVVLPQITCSTLPSVAVGSSVTLQSNPGSLSSIQWIKDGVDITTANGFPANATSTTYVATLPGEYQFRASYSGIASPGTSAPFKVSPIGGNSGSSYNTAGMTVIKKPGLTSSSGLYSLTSSEYAHSVVYSDGLGQTRQTIAVGQSPLEKDIVLPSAYDSVSVLSYLPYTATVRTGWLQPAALSGASGYSNSDQKNFYNGGTTAVASDSYPYAKTLVENSPLGRATEQGSVGSAWQPGSGHTVRTEFSPNNSNYPVRRWTPAGPDGNYAANTLASSVLTDENGNKVITYTDNLGNTVLKRVQTSGMSDSTTWLETYYAYDLRGNLSMQIPPSASAALNGGASWDTTTFRDKWCFLYRYDSKNQLVEKKSPGASAMYFVYDRLGRMVLTQDGNLRASNKWVFIKYDGKGRPVMTGFYTNSTNTTRTAVQTSVVDPLYSNPSDPYYEDRGTTLQGYTNVSFPTANAPGGSIGVQTVNYYDTYDFDYNGTDDYSYSGQSLTGEGSQGNSFGLPTGSKRLILGTATWLSSYIFYDRFGRAIQSRSNNHLSSSIDNLVTSVYDFDGKVLQTKAFHNAGGSNQTTVLNTYTYDHAGRVLTVKQKNNSGTDQILAKYNYNALGQLVDKQLHNTTGSSYLQSVDFRYNIRGWLASINNAELSNDGTLNDDAGDYFGMELSYNGEAGVSNTALYNGSITAVKWKTMGESAGTAGQRSYKYAYDKSDRLTQATFQAYGASSWNKETNTLNEGMSYDHNGNILTLTRKQNERGLSGTSVTSTAQTLDDLTYTYATGNQMSKVEDAVSSSVGKGDFKNGATLTTEYTYNADGGMTSDRNKGIDSIRYNDLGKPYRIKFSDGRLITYQYDAAGAKLTVKNYDTGGTLTTTTDYVGGFVYVNGSLDFFSSPEGRVVKNGSSLEYQYAITDHQGNTRVLFTSATPDPVAQTATFEGDGGDDSDEFSYVGDVVTFNSANHTAGGGKVVRLNQNDPVGAAKSLKVYPGDKVDMEVYSYFESSSGYGTGNEGASAMAAVIAGAFGGFTGGGGESGTIFEGVNAALGGFGLGANPGDSRPSAFLNYILFDKNYKTLDMGWTVVPASASFSKQKISIPQVTVKEAGYIFVYLSYEDESNNYVYFDDFRVTHTKSNIIQSNEYYPFGMQTANSWTRDNVTNNFLSNGGTELNTTSQLYDLDFRSYDPILGRMSQVDPMAHKYSSLTSYNFSFNNPVNHNDPNGADPHQTVFDYIQAQWQSNTIAPFLPALSLVADGQGGNRGGDGPVTRTYSGAQALQRGIEYTNKFGTWGTPGVASSPMEAIKNYAAANGGSYTVGGDLVYLTTLEHVDAVGDLSNMWTFTNVIDLKNRTQDEYLFELYKAQVLGEKQLDLFSLGGQLFDAGATIYGGIESGITTFRQANGAQKLSRAIGFGTQRQAAALSGTAGIVGKLGRGLGALGYGLQVVSIGSKVLNGEHISKADKVGFSISTVLVGAAWIAGTTVLAPWVAGAALIYGAVELISYAVSGESLETNIFRK